MPSSVNWNSQEEAFRDKDFNPDVGGRNCNKSAVFTLYVTGIPLELSSVAFKNLFQSYGNVINVKILPAKCEMDARAGFVEFESLRGAENAIRNLNNASLGKCTLRVSHARKKQNNDSSYKKLINRLEVGPLIDADLKRMLQKADEELQNPSSCSNFSGSNTMNDASAQNMKQSPRRANKMKVKEPYEDIQLEREISKLSEKKVLANMLPCDACSTLTQKVCSSCSVSRYCTAQCQKLEWPQHKKICKTMGANKEKSDEEPLVVIGNTFLEKFTKKLNVCITKYSDSKQGECKPLSLSVGSSLNFMVTDFDSQTGTLFCRVEDQPQALKKLQVVLNEFYISKSAKPLSDAKVGDVCACIFSEDGKWYRATILQVMAGDKVQVQFIDYGNTEVTEKSMLKYLKDYFQKLPAFIIKCKLAGCEAKEIWSDDSIQFLRATLQKNGLSLKGTVTKFANGCVTGNFWSDDVCLNDEIKNRASAKLDRASSSPKKIVSPSANKAKVPVEVANPGSSEFSKVSRSLAGGSPPMEEFTKSPSPVRAVNSTIGKISVAGCNGDGSKNTLMKKLQLQPLVIPDNLFSVEISHVENPGLFYCQIVQNGLSEMSKELQLLTSHFQSQQEKVDYSPQVEDICAAMFAKDGIWYRAKVEQFLQPDLVKVRSVDFGNCEAVPVDKLQPLPENYTTLPVQCFMASLSDCYPVKLEGWCDDAISLLNNCQNTALDTRVDGEMSPNGVTPLILHIDEILTFNDHLVSVGLASRNVAQPKEKLPKKQLKISAAISIPHLQPPIDDIISINLTCCSIPGIFYCQLITDELAELGALAKELNAFCQNGKGSVISNPSSGVVCAAFFSEDQCWYRAKIMEAHEDRVHVQYVDYGNSAWVTLKEIIELPLEFSNLPMQALSCLLAYTKPANDLGWKEDFVFSTNTLLSQPIDAKFISQNENVYVCHVPNLSTLLIEQGAARAAF